MSVVKPVRSKRFLATLSVLVVVAGMLLGARVAVADSVWYQSYQRASQAEACAAQVGETPWQARSEVPAEMLPRGLTYVKSPKSLSLARFALNGKDSTSSQTPARGSHPSVLMAADEIAQACSRLVTGHLVR